VLTRGVDIHEDHPRFSSLPFALVAGPPQRGALVLGAPATPRADYAGGLRESEVGADVAGIVIS